MRSMVAVVLPGGPLAHGGSQRRGIELPGRSLGAGARRVELGELELQAARLLAGARRRAPVPGAVGVELPGALVVGEGALERVQQLGAQLVGDSIGTASSTRWSRLRGIRSAEAM